MVEALDFGGSRHDPVIALFPWTTNFMPYDLLSVSIQMNKWVKVALCWEVTL